MALQKLQSIRERADGRSNLLSQMLKQYTSTGPRETPFQTQAQNSCYFTSSDNETSLVSFFARKISHNQVRIAHSSEPEILVDAVSSLEASAYILGSLASFSLLFQSAEQASFPSRSHGSVLGRRRRLAPRVFVLRVSSSPSRNRTTASEGEGPRRCGWG
jgi:hypothetical protein